MKTILPVAGLIAVVLAFSSMVHAQGRPTGPGGNQSQRPTPAQQRDADAERQRSEERRQEEETRRTEAEAKSRADQSRAEHPPNEHSADAATDTEANASGAEKAEEMRARRDERKTVQEEYRADREPGQEGANSEEAGKDVDEGQKEKAKKPWWKFWGD